MSNKKRTLKEVGDEKESEQLNLPVKKRKLNPTALSDENSSSSPKANESSTPKPKGYVLVIDTEANGWREMRFDENGVRLFGADPESRIAQLAWTVYDANGNKIQTVSKFIQPDGWKVSDQPQRVIKQDTLENEGVPIVTVLQDLNAEFQNMVENDGFLVAHNYAYDAVMILNEIKRCKLSETEGIFTKLRERLQAKPSVMSRVIDTHDLCILEKLNTNDKFTKAAHARKLDRKLNWWPERQWGPQLGVLHQVICGGNKHTNAHDAGIDTEMCGEILFALKAKFGVDLFLSDS
eukprot:171862_1